MSSLYTFLQSLSSPLGAAILAKLNAQHTELAMASVLLLIILMEQLTEVISSTNFKRQHGHIRSGDSQQQQQQQQVEEDEEPLQMQVQHNEQQLQLREAHPGCYARLLHHNEQREGEWWEGHQRLGQQQGGHNQQQQQQWRWRACPQPAAPQSANELELRQVSIATASGLGKQAFKSILSSLTRLSSEPLNSKHELSSAAAAGAAVVEALETTSDGSPPAAQQLPLQLPVSLRHDEGQNGEAMPLLHGEALPFIQLRSPPTAGTRPSSSSSMSITKPWSFAGTSVWCRCCQAPEGGGTSWLRILGVGSVAGTLSGVMGGLTGGSGAWSSLPEAHRNNLMSRGPSFGSYT